MAVLHTNSEFVIFVTHVEAEDQFLKIWGQVDKNSATYVERMILPLFEQFARGRGCPEPQSGLAINALCCARFQNDGYYRARVCNICPDGMVVLQFIDYGNIEVLPQNEIHLLKNIPGSETLQSLPPVAMEFTLANILPINGIWDNKTIETIKKILRYNEYTASPVSVNGHHRLIKLYYNNEDFAELLVKRHMALPATLQELFRAQRVQSIQTPPYHMQSRKMINETCMTNQSNLNTAFNTMQGQGIGKQGTWQNVSVPCIQPQKLVSHPPVQEALVFKSRVLDVGSKHDIYVSFVEDGPQKFSVQVQSTTEILSKLMRDINAHPTEPLQEPPLPGSVCLGRYKVDKVLCRAVVMAVMENKCKLYYVDFGHSEILPYTDIFQLPPQFISPKVLSIRFTLSGVKELKITREMTEYFKNIVTGKSLVLHVRPPEGPPLIQYGDLYDNGNNVKDILRQAFSVPTAVPNTLLYQEQRQLLKGGEEVVHVSFIESCGKFFVQLDNSVKSLESVMACLAECAQTAPTFHPNQITVGAPCAALYDTQWYRAKILNIDGDKIRVLYVDYGNEETVAVDSLRVIHNDLVTKLPAQAITCTLNGHNTLPTDQEFCNQFETLVLDKRLYMRVVDVLPGRLLVDLYDPDLKDDIKNKLCRTLTGDKNSTVKSDSFGLEHQSSQEVPKKVQRSYITVPLTVEHLQKNKLKNMKIIRDNTSKWNKANQEDLTRKADSSYHEHNKSKPWKNDVNGERQQDNRYEKSNVFHDTPKNERISKDGFKGNRTTKDESYNKRNYNDSNSSYRGGRDSRSRGKPFSNDTRFNRSSGFEKTWSDKDSDTSSRGSSKRGRGASGNRRGRGRPRTEGVSGRLHNSRWSDNENDKDIKNGRTNNQKMHNSRDKTNYNKSRITSKEDNSLESWDVPKKLGTSNTAVQNYEKSQLSKSSSQNIEIPLPSIPLGATKTCMTVFVNSPSDFFIQLNPDYLELNSIMESIASIYENGGDVLQPLDIQPGKYCIAQYTEDLTWYRAIIKAVEKQQAVVQFIDYGNIQSVDFEKIKIIQKEFLKLPTQAIHCKLLGAKNQMWQPDATNSFLNKIDGKDLEAEFITKENDTYDIMLREVVDAVPRSSYINEDFTDGVDVMKLREAALDQIKLMETEKQPTEYDYAPPNSKWTSQFYEIGSLKTVIITWFINPNNFYCQTLDKEIEFRNMMNEIQKIYVGRQPVTYTLQVGSSVIAIFSEDKALYRAEIIEQSKNDGYIVQYIDFGNRALVNKTDIYPVEKKLMQLPKQACHCSLQNIKPLTNANWTAINAQAIDACFNADKYECLFHNVENDKYIVSLSYCGENVANTLITKNLASYIVADTPRSINESSTTESEKQIDMQQIDINLLDGQTLKVKVCNVESANKFHIQLPSIIENVSNTCTTNGNFKLLADKQNRPIECCLLNASSFETSKEFKEITENKETIIYIVKVENNRLIVKLYDLSGNKIKGRTDSDEKICLILPMPILNNTYKVIVSYADHSGSIWLQRNVDYEKDIQLSQTLGQYYPNFGKVLKPEINMLCAVKGVDGYWNRAKIIKLTEKSAYVNFVDYGNTQEIDIESLMELDQQFYVPYQLAINVSLTVILNGTLSEQINILQNQLSNKELSAEFYNVNKKWMVELFDNEEKMSDKFRSLNLVKSLTGKESENDQLIIGNKYNVYVSHIDSPSQFWIQLTAEAEIIKESHTELQTEVTTCPVISGILEEGTLCAAPYSIDNMWYRAEVLDADEDITTVRFIDYGNTDVIDNKANNIRALTEKWKSMKKYAMKSRLDIIPVDSEDWNEATCERFSNLVTSVDSLEALIIADSTPKRIELFINDKSISEMLVQENHALRIYAEQDLINEIVELELDPHSAFVSHVNSPNEFWVQEEKSITDLEVMSDRFMVADMFPKVDEIKENLLCVAKFPEDEQWYRARVISQNNGETKVIYIDYGNSAISTEIRAIPEDLAKIPPLSRRCCLALPEGVTEWSDEACKEFIKLAADGATIFLLDVIKEQEISLVRLTLDEKNVADLLADFCEQEITDIKERLPPLGEENSPNVVVSHVNTPAEFWIQAESSITELEAMSDRLQTAPSFLPMTNLESGTICAAQYPEDEQWYRAKILSQDGNNVNVLYIDYGNTAVTTELRILPEDIVNIPILSKRCALQKPHNIPSWSEEACQSFKDLAAEGATMFQFEILDNEDPMHVKLSIDGKNITEILLPLCESTSTNDTTKIIVKRTANNTLEPVSEQKETDKSPEKLVVQTAFSIKEINETNSIPNVPELTVDDIIKNMIDDTHTDSETQDSTQADVDNTIQCSSENLSTQEVLRIDNLEVPSGKNEINTDSELKEINVIQNVLNDDTQEDDKITTYNTHSSQTLLEKQETMHSLKESSDINVTDVEISKESTEDQQLETIYIEIANTSVDENEIEDTELKCLSSVSESDKLSDINVSDIDISDTSSKQEEVVECSLNVSISEETTNVAVTDTNANDRALEDSESNCSGNVSISDKITTDNIHSNETLLGEQKPIQSLKVSSDINVTDVAISKESTEDQQLETIYIEIANTSVNENEIEDTELKCLSSVSGSEKLSDINVNDIDISDTSSKQEEVVECSLNVSISEETTNVAVTDTNVNDETLEDAESNCSANVSISKQLSDTKVINIDISDTASEQQNIDCSPNTSIKGECDPEILENANSGTKGSEKQELTITNADSTQESVDDKIANKVDINKTCTEEEPRKCFSEIPALGDFTDLKMSENVGISKNSPEQHGVTLPETSMSKELNDTKTTDNTDISTSSSQKQDLTCTEDNSCLKGSPTSTITESTMKHDTEKTSI